MVERMPHVDSCMSQRAVSANAEGLGRRWVEVWAAVLGERRRRKSKQAKGKTSGDAA